MGLDMVLYGINNSEAIEVGYWRKANAIHKWFVDNIQNGIDNCDTYRVEEYQLKELKAICDEVIQNPQLADEKLPTQSGFFFGSTDYDEYYFDDLQETIDFIEKGLKEKYDYYKYSSSW